MSIDWDIDSYKTEFETEEHWELKKRFMLTHKDKFPEDELVCLAQVFTNIEFMGCRYPEQTMKRVAYLAKGVVEDFREKKKNCLKRTFVAASDAASAKVKGLAAHQVAKPMPNQDEPQIKDIKIVQNQSNNSNGPTAPQKMKPTPDPDEPDIEVIKIKRIWSNNSKGLAAPQDLEPIPDPVDLKMNEIDLIQINELIDSIGKLSKQGKKELKLKKKQLELMRLEAVKAMFFSKMTNGRHHLDDSKPSVLDDFIVLYLEKKENPLSILTKSTAANNCNMRWAYEKSIRGENVSKLYFNGELIAAEGGDSLKSCRRKTAQVALDRLKENCYGIKLNTSYEALGVSNRDFGVGDHSSSNNLGENNIGAKLMLLMGWKGGGLGRKEQGIKEPITPNILARREGLGSSVSRPVGNLNKAPMSTCDLRTFKRKAENFIKNWLRSGSRDDLVFSSEFTPEERRELHSIANAYSLKSKSRGGKNNRRLFISRRQTPLEIVEDLVRAGGSTKKFDLVYPAKITNPPHLRYNRRD